MTDVPITVGIFFFLFVKYCFLSSTTGNVFELRGKNFNDDLDVTHYLYADDDDDDDDDDNRLV